MPQTAAPLVLTAEDRAELARWSQGRLPWLAERARIVLACADHPRRSGELGILAGWPGGGTSRPLPAALRAVRLGDRARRARDRSFRRSRPRRHGRATTLAAIPCSKIW